VRTLVVRQHGLHVVRVVGYDGWSSANSMWVTRKFGVQVSAFHPISSAFNIVQVDGKQQRGERTSLLNTKKWLHRSCLIPLG